jgi:hypothetical protein
MVTKVLKLEDYLLFFRAPVDQSAQIISIGWNSSLIALAVSEFKPKASDPVRYWAMFPGKMARKNKAVSQPICLRYRAMNKRPSPRAISTAPEANTTKSASSGNQVGT